MTTKTTHYQSFTPQSTNIGGYRYFFNGQEGDNEVFGNVALHAFEYRMHDARLGRFWSVDPLAAKYPWNSTYAFCENTPIWARELEGLEADKSYSGSGWGHGIRRQIARVLNVDENISSIVGAGINSILQSDQVNVTGDVLEKIKKDPAISQMENEYLRDIKSDAKFGKQDFQKKFENAVQLGGKRSPEPMEEQLKEPFNPKYKDTWKVAANELTWLVRSVKVTTDVSITITGTVTMNHNFTDVFDLRPGKNRSDAYNNTTTILGFIYHDVLGGNDKMKIKASWTSEYHINK